MPSIPSATELTQDLVRMDTRNPPGREVECAEYLRALIERAGLEVSSHEFAAGRTSMVARLRGRGAKPAICFGGHIDVVPLGAKPWSVDPFGAEIIDGKLFGRGATDMKAGIAAFVHAALKLAAGGTRGEADVVLAICAGEETGCQGSFHLGKVGALGTAGAIVIAEPTSNYPILGHKGALWLKVETDGVTAHGSMPEVGVNAIYKAARAVTRLEDFAFDAKPHALLGKSTLNVGTMSGGINFNSVPDHAEFTIDIRSLPEQSHQDIMATLKRYIGKDARIDTLVSVDGVATSPEHPWIKDIYALMAPILGEEIKPRGAPYFTDASALNPAYGRPPTVILGPGDMTMAHQTDEYCPVAHIEQAAEVYEVIARRWCGC
ncbi:MAG: M20 family metallopeptidase [Candidatus Binatia bacterium]